jgi:hypothetical protein
MPEAYAAIRSEPVTDAIAIPLKTHASDLTHTG